jgi:hypothetical protein
MFRSTELAAQWRPARSPEPPALHPGHVEIGRNLIEGCPWGKSTKAKTSGARTISQPPDRCAKLLPTKPLPALIDCLLPSVLHLRQLLGDQELDDVSPTSVGISGRQRASAFGPIIALSRRYELQLDAPTPRKVRQHRERQCVLAGNLRRSNGSSASTHLGVRFGDFAKGCDRLVTPSHQSNALAAYVDRSSCRSGRVLGRAPCQD